MSVINVEDKENTNQNIQAEEGQKIKEEIPEQDTKPKPDLKKIEKNLKKYEDEFEAKDMAGIFSVLSSFLMALGCLALFLFNMFKGKNIINNAIVSGLIYLFSLVLLVFFSVSFIMNCFIYKNDESEGKAVYLMNSNYYTIKTFICCFILNFIRTKYYDFFFNEIINPLNFNQFVSIATLSNFIHCLILLLLFSLIKKFILNSIQHRTHHKIYSHRINANKNLIEKIKELEKIAGRRNKSTSNKSWSEHVFSSLVNNNEREYLTSTDFVKLYGLETGTVLFELFDSDNDNKVTKDEFVTRYCSLYDEKLNLSKALINNKGAIRKLARLLNFILFPLYFITVYVNYAGRKKLLENFGFIGTATLSLSFAFSSTISEIVSNLVFVYFVRPIDAGDIVKIKDKVLKVKSLGIMASNFYKGGCAISISNSELRKMELLNFREMTYKKEVIKKKYTYDSSVDKFDRLHQKIQRYLGKNRNKFLKEFKMKNFRFGKGYVRVEIQIKPKCKYQEIKKVYRQVDEFCIFLDRTERDLGLMEYEF